MARIFTIDFEFKGASHAAIASTWTSGNQPDTYRISIHDEALHYLVPDGVIHISMADAGSQHRNGEQDVLVQCLRKAVTGYLQKNNSVYK